MFEKLFSHIDLLRAKPHHVRERITLAAAALVTLSLFVVWIAREKQVLSLAPASEGAPASSATQVASPFGAIVEGWNHLFGPSEQK